jgi:hypothetical protein
MTTDEKDFHLKEFEGLRKEIEYSLNEFHSVQRYAILATGAVWAWLFTQNVTTWEAWGIPLLFTILGAIRQVALFEQMKTISGYIRKLEKKFCDTYLGYEHFYRVERKNLKTAAYSNFLVWLILPVLTLAMTKVGPRAATESLAKKQSATKVEK